MKKSGFHGMSCQGFVAVAQLESVHLPAIIGLNLPQHPLLTLNYEKK